MDSSEPLNVGDLVRCFNWQYYGEIALVLEIEKESVHVYIFDDKIKKHLHKSLISLLRRCPADEPQP
tara:strand:+ start:1037 stop:1237 length:201 start_codon:yes stop_codon:yes gene_type:complete